MSTPISLNGFLRGLGACADAVRWAKDYETLTEAWAVCERADWMMWLIGKMADRQGWPARKQVVSLTCDFAEDALPIYEKKCPNDKRVRDCIATVRKWVAGKATIEDVCKARTEADAAAAAAAAYAADVRRVKLKEYADLIRQKVKVPENL